MLKRIREEINNKLQIGRRTRLRCGARSSRAWRICSRTKISTSYRRGQQAAWPSIFLGRSPSNLLKLRFQQGKNFEITIMKSKYDQEHSSYYPKDSMRNLFRKSIRVKELRDTKTGYYKSFRLIWPRHIAVPQHPAT